MSTRASVAPRRLVNAYLLALQTVESAGYVDEVDLQFWTCRSPRASETEFLREYSWVVLNSGFRESTVRGLFARIEEAFEGFSSAAAVAHRAEHCARRALGIFSSVAKVWAIVDVCRLVDREGLSAVYDPETEPVLRRKLPFIGAVTRAHLLKNLGCNVAKDDRHLRRLSAVTGFSSGPELCARVADLTGHPVAAVDTVLWRYCVLSTAAVEDFSRQLSGAH